MRKALSDVSYVQHLTGNVRELVVGAYVSSFHSAFFTCLGIATACFVVSLTLKERHF